MSLLLQEKAISLASISSHAHHEVATSTTYFFAALLAGMILCLALEEKIHAKKSVIVGIFALVALFFRDLVRVAALRGRKSPVHWRT